jgi:hypothetical protein
MNRHLAQQLDGRIYGLDRLHRQHGFTGSILYFTLPWMIFDKIQDRPENIGAKVGILVRYEISAKSFCFEAEFFKTQLLTQPA